MAQESVEIVRRFIADVNDHDLPAALARVAPGAELDWTGSDAPDSGRYEGPEEWGRWIAGRWEGLGEVTFDATELREVAPDTVLLVAHMRGRGPASGLQIQALAAAVVTLADGMIAGLRVHQTRAEALRALGLDG